MLGVEVIRISFKSVLDFMDSCDSIGRMPRLVTRNLETKHPLREIDSRGEDLLRIYLADDRCHQSQSLWTHFHQR